MSDHMASWRAVAGTPLSFLRGYESALEEHARGALERALAEGRLSETEGAARWYWRGMEWDTSYFGVPMYKLETAAWDEAVPDPVEALAASARRFLSSMDTPDGQYYVWAELPAEDSVPIQALGASGFRLTETRLTYYLPNAGQGEWPERYPVRLADEEDIGHLRHVAVTARNPYDRYHVDRFFGSDVADRYLATYVEESVKDLADFVVVPDPRDGDLPGGFFTATLSVPPACPLGGPLPCELQLGVGRIPLVAVTPERSGWHLRLLIETTRRLSEQSADVVVMTTQATNHAVRRNCEKVGYRLGRVTHVLVASCGKAR